MAYQEFFCNSAGSNMNGGSEGTSTTAIGAAVLTSTNGAWDAIATDTTVSTFTCSDSPTLTAGMVGMYASVFQDGDTTPTANRYVNALITAIDNTAKTITLSIAKRNTLGTPIADQANGYTIKVGGAWAGPAATVQFPFAFITGAAVDTTGNCSPRVNFNGTFNITAGIDHNLAGPVVFEGYTTAAGDGGYAILDGGSPATSLNMFQLRGTANGLRYFKAQNNGAGNLYPQGYGLNIAGNGNWIMRCVATAIRGNGIIVASASAEAFECEVYGCGMGNTAAFFVQQGVARRCISHDNSGGTLTAGFTIGNYGSAAWLIDCVSESNSGNGVHVAIGATGGGAQIVGCDIYNNAVDGVRIVTAAGVHARVIIENCNLVKNTGYGINNSSTGQCTGMIRNCGFGAGTQVNGSGATNNLKSTEVLDSVTYSDDVTPWTDPANGDFRISLAAAKGTGRGAFLQTAPSYAGTVRYPDIGAGQHQDSGGGGLPRNRGILSGGSL
ncbi:MAG: right-handed parallel beta-helix repeat-containing protein [Planctomycetaceae bacterium]